MTGFCARPPFALDRLRELNPERLRYEGTKPGPGGSASLLLTPLELLDRLAALDQPSRVAPVCSRPTQEIRKDASQCFQALGDIWLLRRSSGCGHRRIPRRRPLSSVGPIGMVYGRAIGT